MNMNLQDFANNISYEKSQQPIADNFYKRIYGNLCNLTRYDYDTEENKIMQRKGIDCTIIDRFTNPPRVIDIQEKFRTEDCGDMLIELYSVFPNKLGWGITDEVDCYAYFIDPEYYRKIKHIDPRDVVYGKVYTMRAEVVNDAAKWALNIFEHASWKDEWMINDKMVFKKISATCNEKEIPIKYIKSYSKDEYGNQWLSIGVCIRWSDLKRFFGEIKEYITVDKNHL